MRSAVLVCYLGSMGFGFRKSFKTGPFRTTLSRSGVSGSVGVGGARLTAGPRGTHVTLSKGGFYYRTRLGKAPRPNRNSPVPPVPRETLEAFTPIRTPPTEGVATVLAPETFGDIAPDAVVEAMNRRMKRRNYAFPAGIVVSGGLLAASVPWPIVAVVGVLATVLVSMHHIRSKYSSLVYEDEKEISDRIETLHKAITALRSADSVWSVREASSTNGLKAHPSTLGRFEIRGDPPPLPKYLRTNITPASLPLADGALYFFPDRLFIWHSGQFAAIDYGQLTVRFSRITFLEREKQPPDAAVESRIRRSQFRAVTGGLETAGKEEMAETLYTHFDSRVPLFYDLEDGFRQVQALRAAFAIIQRCEYVWRYEGEERTDDWKRNAGAGTLVVRSRFSARLVDQSPGFESNVAFGFCFGHSTIFLLPDGLFLGTGEHYQALGKSLDANATTIDFREEEASPSDAELVGTTWRYVNKSGGPDRRFNDNRRIPIYRYGRLEIGCGSWRIRLCLSQAKAAAEFAASLQSAIGGRSHAAPADAADVAPPVPLTPTTSLASAFSALGLEAGASLEEASAAYRSWAAQSHPDKVAHLAPEFRELAERKMRELNAAYERVREFHEQR